MGISFIDNACLDVCLMYSVRDFLAESIKSDVCRHLADKSGNEFHAISAVAHQWVDALLAFACTSIDDSDKVVGDDNAVFTTCSIVFASDELFVYFDHGYLFFLEIRLN